MKTQPMTMPGAATKAALIAMARRLRRLEDEIDDAQLALDALVTAVGEDLGLDVEALVTLMEEPDAE